MKRASRATVSSWSGVTGAEAVSEGLTESSALLLPHRVTTMDPRVSGRFTALAYSCAVRPPPGPALSQVVRLAGKRSKGDSGESARGRGRSPPGRGAAATMAG